MPVGCCLRGANISTVWKNERQQQPTAWFDPQAGKLPFRHVNNPCKVFGGRVCATQHGKSPDGEHHSRNCCLDELTNWRVMTPIKHYCACVWILTVLFWFKPLVNDLKVIMRNKSCLFRHSVFESPLRNHVSGLAFFHRFVLDGLCHRSID